MIEFVGHLGFKKRININMYLEKHGLYSHYLVVYPALDPILN